MEMRPTHQERALSALIRRTQRAVSLSTPRPAAPVLGTIDPRRQPHTRVIGTDETFSGDLRSRFPLPGRCAWPSRETPNHRHMFKPHRYRSLPKHQQELKDKRRFELYCVRGLHAVAV
jgi:hypothetical protein